MAPPQLEADRLRHGRFRGLAAAFRRPPGRARPPFARQNQFEWGLLRIFSRELRRSSLASAGLSGAAAMLATFFIPLAAVLTWLGLQALLLGVTYCLAGQFLRHADQIFEPARWRWGFIALETCRGLAWGALAAFVLAAGHPAAWAFGMMVYLSASAVAAATSVSVPTAAVGAVTGMSAMVLLGLLQSGIDYGASALVAFACCAEACLLWAARKARATTLEALSIQAEKDGLIAELEAAKVASDLARRRAENANFAKSRFLAAMSHELRTPLNAILGFSEVMKGELFGAHSVASYKEYSHDIHESGQHLLVLINEILDLSRIEAGRFELKEEAVRLDHVVADCRHLLALRAKERRISIESAVELDLPPLRADGRALRQIVLNLLSNAIKFTPRGGAIGIKIGWTTRGGQYVSVRDTGPGIPQEELPTIMMPFGRGTLAEERAEEGSGLGLSIVKGLTELHGGTFMLRSKLREGTEAIVIFPRDRVSPPAHSIGPRTAGSGPATCRGG